MTYRDHDDSIWVHERDYGGNPIGDFIGAFWNLGVAAVLIVLLVVRKISDRLS